MKFRKFLSVVLSLCLLASSLPLTTSAEVLLSGYCDEWNTSTIYTLDTVGKLEITTVDGYYGSVYSETFQGWNGISEVNINGNVLHIDTSAFESCINLVSVDFPECLTSIGNTAFLSCSLLTELDLPDGLQSIGTDAFRYCGIKHLTLPDSVTYMGSGTFRDNTDLVSVEIGSGIKILSSETFSGCTSLTAAVLPDTITQLGSGAFKNCTSLKTVVLPNNLTDMYCEVFCGCTSLKSIYVPSSVTYIDIDTFSTLGASEGADIVFICEAGSYAETYANEHDGITAVSCTTGTCGDNATYVLGEDGTLIISGTGEIAGDDFNEKNITSVVVKKGITSIKNKAFGECTSLESVILPNGLTEIGENAFINCESLADISVPDTLTYVGPMRFPAAINLIIPLKKT